MGKQQQAPPPQAISTIPPELSGLLSKLGSFFGGVDFSKVTPQAGQLQNAFFGSTGGQGGFLGQGLGFVSDLMAGKVPQSLQDTVQKNYLLQSQNLNSELQKRGAFFSTPALQQQEALSADTGRNLNNIIFQNASQGLGLGEGLFGLGSGLANLTNPFLSPAIGLLGSSHGQLYQPQFQQDPFSGLLGGLLGVFGGGGLFPHFFG